MRQSHQQKGYAYTTGSLNGVTPTDTVSYTYGDSQWGDLLTAYDGNTITSDEIGNMLTDGTWTYTWQHGRQLASMTDGTDTWTYTYNASGMRTGRTDGENTYEYVYAGSDLVYMSVNGTPLRFSHTPDGTPMSVVFSGGTYYYVTNLQGDVVAIVDMNGNAMVTYTYDAWGNLIDTVTAEGNATAAALAAANPLRYRGYVYDNETGLYYVSSRYYDPEIGRWINADGAYDTNQGVLGYNMYAYCLNNPVNMYDPDGGCSKFLGFLWKIDCKQASCPTSKNYIKPKSFDPIGSYNKGQGYVYVVMEDQLSDIMENKENYVVVIVDKRTSSDPNMQIQESYKITKTKQQKEIAQLMIDYNASNPVDPAWSRTLESLVKEWQIHNFVYDLGYKRDRTGDCDFNNTDEGKGFWDFIGR